MSNGRKPKGKHVLELHFDTKIGVENFIAIYLDGGGDHTMGYDAVAWGKKWMQMKTMSRCAACEWYDPYGSDRVVNTKCPNCNTPFPKLEEE